MTRIGVFYHKDFAGKCDICERVVSECYIFIVSEFKPILVCYTCLTNICKKMGITPQKGDSE